MGVIKFSPSVIFESPWSPSFNTERNRLTGRLLMAPNPPQVLPMTAEHSELAVPLECRWHWEIMPVMGLPRRPALSCVARMQ